MNHRTMPSMSIRRQLAAATATVFIVLIGLRFYVDVWKLLSSYLPVNESTHELRDSVRNSTVHDNDEDEDDGLLFDEKDDDYIPTFHDNDEDEDDDDYESGDSLAELTRLLDLNRQQSQKQTKSQSEELHYIQQSPACKPHFRYLSSSTSWETSSTKFKRLYFYHARKAGGTSLAMYFAKVATHHGLKFQHDEWVVAEEPGTKNDELPTFYVAHLREPVDRAISHFRYQGRWDCHDLMHMNKRNPDKNGNYFTPTEENSNKLETWNATGGHTPHKCKKSHHFKLGLCAVNCYLQWFAGAISCPENDIPIDEQYQLVLTKLLRYNFIIILEWLQDPEYVLAVEKFFGVPGITEKKSAFCERSSHYANKMIPLSINNRTLDRLTELNEVDINLYQELTNCSGGDDEHKYNFPILDSNRFDNTSSIQVHYSNYHAWKNSKEGSSKRRRKRDKAKKLDDVDNNNDDDNHHDDINSTDDNLTSR